MKLLKLFFVFALVTMGVVGCAKQKEATIDLGESSVYTEEDRQEAVKAIRKEFDTWEECTLNGIRYAGDECNSEKNIQWMNELKEGQNYTQCIEFLSDFHTSKDAKGAWEPDKDYKDYQWYLARSENGDWELLSWGY